MTRAPDFDGIFHLFAGVRTAPVFSAYRPQHEIHDNYQTSGVHTYLDCDKVEPGGAAKVAMHFITPQAYPHCIWEGRELAVYEGAKVVGKLVVTRIFNPLLRVTPKAYSPIWVTPHGLGPIDRPYEGWENG